MVGTYRLAERIVQIDSFYERVHEYCEDYRLREEEQDLPIDIFVKISQEDLRLERKKSTLSYQPSDKYLEELAVYRQIAEKMPFYQTFLFHGSALAVDGQGYLFAAPSGTGKSTHARLWREWLGNRVTMINDDKPLIRMVGGTPWVYGTPWNGKHRLGTNMSVPLKAICLLERAPENIIEPMSRQDAMSILLRQVYRPVDGQALAKTLQLVDQMAGALRLYRLKCNMEPAAARIAYQGMNDT